MVGVVALIKKGSDGSAEDVRVGLTQMGATPLRASAVEEALRCPEFRTLVTRRLDERRVATRAGRLSSEAIDVLDALGFNVSDVAVLELVGGEDEAH